MRYAPKLPRRPHESALTEQGLSPPHALPFCSGRGQALVSGGGDCSHPCGCVAGCARPGEHCLTGQSCTVPPEDGLPVPWSSGPTENAVTCRGRGALRVRQRCVVARHGSPGVGVHGPTSAGAPPEWRWRWRRSPGLQQDISLLACENSWCFRPPWSVRSMSDLLMIVPWPSVIGYAEGMWNDHRGDQGRPSGC